MSIYLIGDIQGCDAALGRLLEVCGFSASRDHVVLLGDLVNRGPDSAAVLRRVMALGGSASSLLGNHDLHLLAVAHGVRPTHAKDTLDGILQSPERPAMLEWLRQQHLALRHSVAGEELLMVHAGVLPAWDAAQTLALAGEVQAVLRGADWLDFLHHMYGNTPAQWRDDLRGTERLRCIVNALTRLRFCSAAGEMEFAAKEGVATAPAGYMPWFEVPGRRTANVTVAFGHWSTLGWLERDNLLSMDSGCVWGGQLSALRLGTAAQRQQRELLQVPCEMAQQPGA